MVQIKSVYKLISITITIFLISTSYAMAYEEPNYKLIKTTDVYEIRQYEDRLAVQTTQSTGRNGAFGRLFNYISGSNESSSKIAMTVPENVRHQMPLGFGISYAFRDASPLWIMAKIRVR